jgi:hypothetical protein
MKQAEQQGSFHFVDSYEASITRTGAILEDLIPAYYDTARDVTVRTPSGDPNMVRINDDEPGRMPKGQRAPIQVGQGEHDVTLSTGPSFDSEREAANEFADVLLQTPFAPNIADLAVKLKNLGPIGDELAERLLATAPPPVQQIAQKDGDSPEALKAKVGQLEQMLQLVGQELEERTKAAETEQIKAQQNLELAQLKANSDAQIKLAEMEKDAREKAAELAVKREIEFRKLEVQLEIEMAKLGSSVSMKRAEIEQKQLHDHGEALDRQADREAESAEADMNRQAERDARAETQAFQASEAAQDRDVAVQKDAES